MKHLNVIGIGLLELSKINYDLDSRGILIEAVSKLVDTADQRNIGSQVVSMSFFKFVKVGCNAEMYTFKAWVNRSRSW